MDLTRLTAKELRSRFVRLPHDWSLGGQSSMQAPPEEWDEIWLRVERLEKCEANLVAAQNRIDDDTETINRQCKKLGHLRGRLEQCETALELEIVERDKIIGLFSEWDYGQTDSEGPYEHAKRCVSNMMKRLKQYETALRKARMLLINEGDPDEDRETIAEIDALVAAALEGEGRKK